MPRPQRTDRPASDRLPPHSLESEQGVLGCVLLDPPACLDRCVPVLKPELQAFYDLRHQVIFDTLVEMQGQQVAIDVITLQQRLKEKKQLDVVGGISYLSSLADAVPSPANLRYYLDTVLEKAVRRRVINTASAVVAEAFEEDRPFESLINDFEANAMSIRGCMDAPKQTGIKDMVGQAIGKLEAAYKREGRCGGLTTGFHDLDIHHDGLHPNELIVLAGYHKTGKTSLLLALADHIAVDNRIPVGLFSLEMTAIDLVLRIICSRAKINLRDVSRGFIVERDFPRIANAASKVSSSALHVYDGDSGMDVLELRSEARRMVREHNIQMIGIDQMSHLSARSSGKRFSNRREEIEEISRHLKGMAKELKLPVIILSQLNKDGATKQSLALEEDCDSMLVLKHADREPDDERDERLLRINLEIAYQRNGPAPVTVPLLFLKAFTRFESLSKIAAVDVPEQSPFD